MEKKNEVMEVKKLELTEQQYNSTVERITKAMGTLEKGYLNIAGDVAKLADAKAFTERGYKNIYDMCNDLFGMARGTVSNLRQIVARYFDDNYKMRTEYKPFSLRALLVMKELSDEQIALLEITSDMPLADIKSLVESVKALDTETEEEDSDTQETEEVEKSAESSTVESSDKIMTIIYSTDMENIEIANAVKDAFYDGYTQVIFKVI